MMKVVWAVLVLVVGLGGVGCANPLARAQPLRKVTSWRPLAGARQPIVDVSADGLTVVGNAGDALTTATRIHRRLRALRIPNEVRCQFRGKQAEVRTRLRISFPGGLSVDQQQQVRTLLHLVQRTAS